MRLISNKFWLEGGGGLLGGWYWVVSGGEARGQSWRGRIILDGGGGVEGWGVSGGEARGPSWRGRIRGVEVAGRELGGGSLEEGG